MRLFLLRHPEPQGAHGLCYGRTDLPVTPDAVRATTSHLRTHFPGRLDTVISSPLQRCTRVAANLTQSYDIDDRLTELDFGLWENQLWDNISRPEVDHWAKSHLSHPVPGGESWTHLRTRANECLRDLRTKHYESALIVTHAGIIRALLARILDIDLNATWHIQLPFGCVIETLVGLDPRYDRIISICPTHVSPDPPSGRMIPAPSFL